MPICDGPYFILGQKSPSSSIIASLGKTSEPIAWYHTSALAPFKDISKCLAEKERSMTKSCCSTADHKWKNFMCVGNCFKIRSSYPENQKATNYRLLNKKEIGQRILLFNIKKIIVIFLFFYTDPCTPNRCRNDGNCTVNGTSFECACREPFFGKICEEDPCTSNPCLNAGVCSVNGNSFKCACWTPFFGDKCKEDPCTSNPCRNDGSCAIVGNSFKCACREPFFGERCEEDANKLKLAKQEFKFMLENDIIRPSKSPWTCPLHLISEKDGSLRRCGDYRRLKAQTIPDHYPIPRIEDLHHMLKQKKIFSKIDLF
ncbi:Cadherin-related tumor suppressor [Araneus ventricosus]|uniref:Cadherin-related tumor suppressor n=1 Tax=Araneus ventricosus TaxID=182803 RepID=A0A4Y2ULY6_ARAVE|nr:Cadherin-related tumor suppressor [Araneus ventricosus]